MAILTRDAILQAIVAGRIVIDPFNKDQVGPNSIDLRLGDTLGVYRRVRDPGIFRDEEYLDMAKNNEITTFKVSQNGVLLRPNILYLGHTFEYTDTCCYVPCIEGRSSVGRLGINVHATAGFGETGFRGDWTLEITVTEPIMVYPFVPICQIIYHTVEGDITPYKGKYQDQRGPRASKLWQDLNRLGIGGVQHTTE